MIGNQRGFILVTFYMLLVMAITMTGALVAHASAELRAAQRSQASMQALYLAEGGMDWAITQLRQNSAWTGGTGTGATGSYTVAVNTLPNNRRRVTIQGTTNQGITVNRSVESIVQVTANPLFRWAMFGGTSVSLVGNATTDSYNSSNGPYSAGTAGSQGDVGTNGGSAGNIALTGNAVVNGNAYSGAGSNPNTVVTSSGNAVVNGSKLPLTAPEPMLPVTPPSGTNLGDLSVTGNNTTTLPGGTYIYDDISVSGNGRLDFTGPTTIYVTGTFSVAGNGIGTSSSLPPNLIIYVVGSGNVSVGGNASFYGAIYAPESYVHVHGNGAFYGSAIGNTVQNNGNGGVHYDLALQNSGGTGAATVTQLSWQDVS